jgi:alkanesulfonate monooxygenase SsuD/methylene tetrahydromethanopterin reductase-like flavin-dependent oxidoreductase (luciferase family)
MNERDFPGKPKVTFGIRVPNSGPLASPESIVQVAREAESLGYDSIWVHDHLTWTPLLKSAKTKEQGYPMSPKCLHGV